MDVLQNRLLEHHQPVHLRVLIEGNARTALRGREGVDWIEVNLPKNADRKDKKIHPLRDIRFYTPLYYSVALFSNQISSCVDSCWPSGGSTIHTERRTIG